MRERMMIPNRLRPRFATVTLCLCAGLAMFCKAEPGPLERRLIAAEERYANTTAPGERLQIVKDLLELTDARRFVDPTDLERRTDIMYRASLLAATALFRLDNPKAARSLYMNAFLLREDRALQDIRDRLGAQSDLEIFEAVRIPAYEVAAQTEGDGSVRYRIEVGQRYPYFLLQMICGDLVRKLRAEAQREPGTIPPRMLAEIRGPGGLFAEGRWDPQEDEIVIKQL